MPIDVHPKRRQPNTEQIVEEQKRQARLLKEQQQAAKAAASVPAKVTATVPTPLAVDNRSAQEKYIDEVAPSTIAGQMVKFSKEGKFIVSETEEEIGPDQDFVALCDEVLIGYVRFNGEGEPPDRHQGLLYQGFTLPPRGSLGDMDQSQWSLGLDGLPADPWQHQICLVLQDPRSLALYTFVTSSITGRRAVGNLLRHFDRMRRNATSGHPIVRLRPSGFQSKKKGVGWVHTPSFVVVGRTAKDSAAPPDSSVAADMNDSLPI
jgi:hypothetical protein